MCITAVDRGEVGVSNIDLVKEITEALARNTNDREVLERYFAPDFKHWANGSRSDLKGYATHLAGYQLRYESFRIPAWDELFEADDRVVAAYVLKAEDKDGATTRLAVIAIWRLKDGKVISLREVDTPVAEG